MRHEKKRVNGQYQNVHILIPRESTSLGGHRPDAKGWRGPGGRDVRWNDASTTYLADLRQWLELILPLLSANHRR
jgi:hypothetical protein